MTVKIPHLKYAVGEIQVTWTTARPCPPCHCGGDHETLQNQNQNKILEVDKQQQQLSLMFPWTVNLFKLQTNPNPPGPSQDPTGGNSTRVEERAHSVIRGC